MSSLRLAAFTALAMSALSGCETTTTTSPTAQRAPVSRNEAAAAKGLTSATAAAEIREFLLERSKAEFYHANCTGQGISLRVPDRQMAIWGQLGGMKQDGYPETMLLNAQSKIGQPDRAMINEVVSEMSAMGARPNQPASFCDAARQEIAKGTPAGKMLKTR